MVISNLYFRGFQDADNELIIKRVTHHFQALNFSIMKVFVLFDSTLDSRFVVVVLLY